MTPKTAPKAKSQKNKATAKSQTKALTAEQKAVHLLDRTTFGPRPGDVERLLQTGWDKYLDEQLYPDRITDAVVVEKLKGLESLTMTNDQIAASYPQQAVIRRALEARGIALPDQQVQQVANAPQNTGTPNPNNPNQNMNQPQGPPVPPGSPLANADPEQRRKVQEVMRELGYRPPAQLIQELQQGKILRAVYSERQLQEVMTDFWFNHFNVFAQKGADRTLITSYERDVIRPNVFGKFEDILRATAKSPAMLFYLDNWLSASPDARPPQRRPGMGPIQGRPGQPGFQGQPGQPRRQGLQGQQGLQGLQGQQDSKDSRDNRDNKEFADKCLVSRPTRCRTKDRIHRVRRQGAVSTRIMLARSWSSTRLASMAATLRKTFRKSRVALPAGVSEIHVAAESSSTTVPTTMTMKR
jgi:hypothetical protein